MYKLTIIDHNTVAFVTFPASFFIDDEDIESFGEFWLNHPDVMDIYKEEFTKSRKDLTYQGSIHGNPYYPLEYDETKLIDEKSFVLEDREFSLLNAWESETKVYAAKATLGYRVIQFKDKYCLLGRYRLEGGARYDELGRGGYSRLDFYGNPILKGAYPSDEKIATLEPAKRLLRKKEDFKEDIVETACWVHMGTASEKDAFSPLSGLDLLSPDNIRNLMEDIPGEGG